MKVVAVFFGGESVEHDVSLITGTLTLNTLDKSKYKPLPVYVHGDGTWYTGENLFDVEEYKNLDFKKLKKVFLLAGDNVLYAVKGGKVKRLTEIAVAINCMHGERGEDGCLSGILKGCNIPLSSPNLLTSSVCMDKAFTKTFLKGIGVKSLPCVKVFSSSQLAVAEKKIGYPMIIKPTFLGSSVGVGQATCKEEGESAIRYALTFGESAIIEKRLSDFIEINCAVYMRANGQVVVSECERPVGRTEILTFNDKYEGGGREFPAKISKEKSEKIKEITKKIYLELGARGIIRIDFFIKGDDIIVNEINTVPGSLAYYLFCDTLGKFKDVLTDVINLAEKEYARSTTFVKKYDTAILSSCGAKGAKRLKKRG